MKITSIECYLGDSAGLSGFVTVKVNTAGARLALPMATVLKRLLDSARILPKK